MDASLAAALQVRQNAEEIQRQMKELLDWEKDVKKSKKLPQKHVNVQVPVRSATPPSTATTPTQSDKKKRIKSADYKAWDKFDDAEVSKIEQEYASDSANSVASRAAAFSAKDDTRESPEQLELRLENSLLEKEKGNAYFKKGDYKKAVKCYSKSIKLNPDSAVVLGNRAMTYLKLNEFQAAEADSTAVLEIEPKNVKALWRRGVARREIGSDLSGAKCDLEKALVLEPTNASVKQELSKVVAALSAMTGKPSATSKPARKRVDIIEVGDSKLYKSPDLLGKKKEEEPLLVERPVAHLKTNTSVVVASDAAKTSSALITPVEPVPQKVLDSVNTVPIQGAKQNSASLEPSNTVPICGSAPSQPPVNIVPIRGCQKSTAPQAQSVEESMQPKIMEPVNIVPIRGSQQKKPSVIQIIDPEIETSSIISSSTSPSTSKKPLIVELDNAFVSIAAKPDASRPPKPIIEEISSRPTTPVTRTDSTLKPPTTMYEFELEWKNRKNDLEALYQLIKSMDPKSFKSVFKNALEPHYLGKIFQILYEHETATRLYETLEGLSLVVRFSMNVMFCSKQEKAVIKGLFGYLEENIGELEEGGKDSVTLKALEKKFGVKK
ncbi:UNVERIFIED_CONTAM: RNA polymerase II-associated protein 3 [Siphonaria sp. JEL0065]|nr:RNA polymerase II-associated protein 3 [Siphonaria sp. JEL0065]